MFLFSGLFRLGFTFYNRYNKRKDERENDVIHSRLNNQKMFEKYTCINETIFVKGPLLYFFTVFIDSMDNASYFRTSLLWQLHFICGSIVSELYVKKDHGFLLL